MEPLDLRSVNKNDTSLDAKFKLAVGVRVTLRHNLDTAEGLVKAVITPDSQFNIEAKSTFLHVLKTVSSVCFRCNISLDCDNFATGMTYMYICCNE